MNSERTKQMNEAGKYGLAGLLSMLSLLGAFALVREVSLSLLAGAGAAMLFGWHAERIERVLEKIETKFRRF